MHTTYFDEDDILVIRLPDKPITRKVLQNWNTHISYAEDSRADERSVIRRLWRWCCWKLAPMGLTRWKCNMRGRLEKHVGNFAHRL